MKRKVGFVSLGCPKNLVDSEVMMGLLQRGGWEVTPNAEEAEVVVVNTCSFIESAQQESVDTILELAELKKTGAAKRLVVAGCMVERFGGDIRSELPEVDALVGTNQLEAILAACGGSAAATPAPGNGLDILPQSFFDPRPTAPYLYDELTPRLRATPRHTAYVKIAEGCDHPCTFCVIPQFRGEFRSRRFESVVREVQRLGAEGVSEVILIGQDTTCYGDDFQLKDGLAQLLARLAGIESLRWIRTLYFYPNRVSQPLLDTVAAHARLCKYVDMPLQHASPAVLKRMQRGGGGDRFLKLLERIRATIAGVALRTTMIVGFPGETEADFAELCQFVEAAQFDWLGVFGYSDEPTGKAFALDGKVEPEVIAGRRERLLQLQRKISRRRRKAQVGQRLVALVEGPSSETDLLWEGRLESQAPEIDGKVLINDFEEGLEPCAGQFATVEITAAHEYDLVGRVVAP